MPRLATAMRNSRFLSRWAELRKITTFSKRIDNLVQSTDKPKRTFYPSECAYTFPLKLPGTFGQRYAEFTVFETTENNDFFNWQLGATDMPKSTFYPCQIMCLHISVKITWNPCPVWPALCGIHGFWEYGKQRLFRSNWQLGAIHWYAQKYFLSIPDNVPTRFR